MPHFPNLENYFNFNRKIASKCLPYIAKTPLRPNHITVLSLIAGFAAAMSFSRGTRIWMLVGAFFLQISFILDNCDGAIARLKNLQSSFGMWLDYIADLFVDFAIWIGLAFGAWAQGVSRLIFVVAGIACLGSLINFLRVAYQRKNQLKIRIQATDSVPRKKILTALASLTDDGDPSLLVWLMALIGYPGYLLLLGLAYIHFIWISAVYRGRKV